jgi:hypothetical protein
MLLVEALLVIQEVALPDWFLPQHTPHDVVTTLHRLFPAFMNGCRCVISAFYVDRKAARVEAMEALAASTRDVSLRAVALVRSVEKLVGHDADDYAVAEDTVEGEGLHLLIISRPASTQLHVLTNF